MQYDQYYARGNFGKKLLKAINNKYSDIPEHKRRGKFKDDYCEQASIDRTKFENRFSSWAYRKVLPETENLIIICNVLDCDIDYFLTTQEVLKKDTVHASEATGLRYDTIDTIINFSPEQKQILDLFTLSIGTTNLGELLTDFFNYAHSNLQHGIVIDDSVEDNNPKKERKLEGNELRTIMSYDISNKINRALEHLRGACWNIDLKSGVNILKKQSDKQIQHLAKELKQHGMGDKEIQEKISELIDDSPYDELYNDLKI